MSTLAILGFMESNVPDISHFAKTRHFVIILVLDRHNDKLNPGS